MIHGDSVSLNGTVISNSVPVDITTGQFRFTAKNYYTDPDSSAVIILTSPTNIVVVNGPLGQFQVLIDPSNTSSLSEVVTKLVYDIQLTLDGNVYTIAQGFLLINPDVSQTTP